MPPKTSTKAALLQQLEQMQESVKSMKDTKVLKLGMERVVDHVMLARTTVDLDYVDHMRKAMKREMAHRLAEELIASGAVRFREELRDDYNRCARSVVLTAELQVC